MLGCRLACSRVQNEQSYILEGPLFTADKLNVNGEGVPATELDRLSKELVGAPIRYCTAGIELDGVPKEHYCGLINSPNTIASVTNVYLKPDDEGKQILYASAKLKDGVNPESLPDGWSMLADYKVKDDDTGFCYGLYQPRIDLTAIPAYDEARIKIYAASTHAGNLNINNKQANDESKDDPHMVDDTQTNQNDVKQTPPAPVVETPKVETPKQDAPKDVFTKDEVTKMFAELSKKFDDEKAKLKEETVVETKQTLEKESKVNELLGQAEKLGVIKPEDREAKFAKYMKLDRETFADVYNDMMAVTQKATERRTDARYEGAALQDKGAVKESDEGRMKILMQFGYTKEQAQKAVESTRNQL